MNLTHREKHVLIIAAVILLVIVIAGSLAPSMQQFNQTTKDWEFVYLFLIVGPLGLYIALDPEHKK